MPVSWKSNPVGGLFAAALSAKAHFFGQAKINCISQLINGIFKVFEKLLKCFSKITTLISFLPILFASQPASPAPRL